MADSLCGPSNAGKGLVNHFDRNRSIQQDRFVNSSPSHNSTSFRSSAHINTGSEAAFNSFHSQTSTSPSPFPPSHLAGIPQNLHPQPPTHPVQPTSMASPSSSWVRDFQQMRIANGSPRHGAATQQANAAMNPAQMNPAALGGPAQQQNFARPHAFAGFEGSTMFSNSYVPQGLMAAVHSDTFVPFHSPVQTTAPMQEAQQQFTVRDHYDLYPQAITAGTDPDVMDAAYAAYDQDFEHEMDQWMAVHGPQPAVDMAEVEANMEAIADEQDAARMRQERAEHQDRPRAPVPGDDGTTTEFRKAAMDILDTVGQNQGDKFKNSSFLELMRRICAKEVVLQGEDLVDVTNNTILGGDNGPVNDNAGTHENLNGEQQSQAENDNGKGKDVAEH